MYARRALLRPRRGCYSTNHADRKARRAWERRAWERRAERGSALPGVGRASCAPSTGKKASPPSTSYAYASGHTNGCFAPQGMHHRRGTRTGIRYGVWGEAPAGGCKGRLPALCTGHGGAAPESPCGVWGAKPSKTVVEASTRRARCAPYGKGRASGNVRRTCLAAHKNVSVCHEACATGVARATAFIMGTWARSPRRPW